MATQKVPSLDGSGRVRQKHLPAHLDPTALSATYVPKWKTATAYLAGDKVLSPTGDVVSSIADHTSGVTFNPANWNFSPTYAKGSDVIQKWKANTSYASGDRVVSPNGDIVTAIAAFTSGAAFDASKWTTPPSVAAVKTAVRLRVPRVPPAPISSMVPASKAGHLWGAGGASGNANLNAAASDMNNTEHVLLGDRAAKLVTNGQGSVEVQLTANITAYDATNDDIRLWLWIEGGVASVKVEMRDAVPNLKNQVFYQIGGVTDLSGFGLQKGRWNVIDIPMSAIGTSATTNIAAITQLRVIITDNGTPANLWLGGWAFTKRAHTNQFPKGALALTCDDSFGTQWSVLRPAMDAYGWRGTLFPIIDQIGSAGNLTMDQVLSLHYDYGWEIGGHATTGLKHAQGLVTMTQSERLIELEGIRTWMDTYGFPATSFAYPIGSHSAAAEKDVSQFFSNGRAALINHIQPQYPANMYGLHSVNVGSQNSQISPRITEMVNGKAVGSLTIHAIKDTGGTGNDITTAQMTSMLSTIAASGISVLPMGEITSVLAA